MKTVDERFLTYVRMNTTSDETSSTCPSTECQKDLAALLVKELHEMGIDNAEMDANGYVYAYIPANCEAKAIGLIAHMDTVDAVPGRVFHPRMLQYEGGDIILNSEKNITLSPTDFPGLNEKIGKHLIVTDGTTVLGGDDKAGVAEIMTVCGKIMECPEIRHGKICIAFTPDEEIGRGADLFDVKRFGADFAFTADGGDISEIEYENFNAASARISVHGRNIHPGGAKSRMKHAARILMEFNALLPANEKPEYTEGYEGFYHLTAIHGNEENAEAGYILRDHDEEKLEIKKKTLQDIAAFLNNRYGEGTVKVQIRDSYRNMREIIEQHPEIIELAKDAIRKNGLTPTCVPVRGGTDGARLSFMGLPCPNLGTGGANCHGVFEYVTVEDMEKMTDILLTIVTAN